MSKILVLGATSFSGNSFALRYPHKDKLFLFGRSPGHQSPHFIPAQKYSKITQWDLNDTQEELISVIQNQKISTVINFAAQSMVGQSWDKPEDWYEANVLAFSKLLKGISALPSVKKFIQFSTPEVYGSTSGWIKESFDFAPNTPYAVSRAAADWHLKALHENFSFPVIFTRAANVYGEHQRLYRIIPRVIISALTGQKVPLQGGGKSIRSFIHIDDVSDALMRIIESGIPGESYHISTNELVTIYELVSIIAEKLNVNIENLIEIAPDRPGKDFAYQLDSSKVRSDLNWSDKISLSDGLDRTIKWVEENIDELRTLPLNYEHRR